MAVVIVQKQVTGAGTINGFKSTRFEKIEKAYGTVPQGSYAPGDILEFPSVPPADLISAVFYSNGNTANIYPSTPLGAPVNLLVGASLLGTTVAAIYGSHIVLAADANATVSTPTSKTWVTTGSINVDASSSSTTAVTLTSEVLPAGFTIGSTLLGSTVSAIAGTSVTLAGNANATVSSTTAEAFTTTGTIYVTSSSTASVDVFAIYPVALATGGAAVDYEFNYVRNGNGNNSLTNVDVISVRTS
jgi:hypothetical protein